jgi:aminoacylase
MIIDARFFRAMGIATYGISPMRSTPVLLHDHNECLSEVIFLEGIEFYKRLVDRLANVVTGSDRFN